MAETTAAIPAPIKDDAGTFQCLFGLAKKKQRIWWPCILRTAAELGWFTEGTLLTMLTKEEERQARLAWKKLSQKCGDVLRYSPWKIIHAYQLGYQLKVVEWLPAREEYPFTPEMAKLESSTGLTTLYAKAWGLRLLQARHPEVAIFSSGSRNETLHAPLRFVKDAGNSRTVVALLSTFNCFALP